ncbi:c-type cytochrome [Actibacterium sp. MT2.3-13A]|uniref:c-type cytochrome n=1 Tax=Actibacterium sp. MT2.3-13A TaxID=2828332 RepID=UPI001BAC0B8A|nr:c-type cytochrome [Actibacterium sp. MT2.3-13A]
MRTIRILAACAALTLPAAASAQGMSIGEREYMNSCAQCHGPAGKGDGFLVNYFLEGGAPDITGLAKANGGVFPVARVYAIIDGTATAGIHGDSMMPAWGYRYSLQADEDLGRYFALSAEDRAAAVRGRILALIEHLSTLQGE